MPHGYPNWMFQKPPTRSTPPKCPHREVPTPVRGEEGGGGEEESGEQTSQTARTVGVEGQPTTKEEVMELQ